MVLLPLKDEQGRPTRVLGALHAKGKIGRGPRRFRITEQTVEPLLSDTGTQYPQADEMASRPSEVAEQTTHHDAEPAPLLRLVHDADERAE
jgi:hypothetical protein